jgi:site-specific DNA-methyltransferase (adenine-specific)/adenine-specific DNA-methyltransferase
VAHGSGSLQDGWRNLLIHGDNLEVMSALRGDLCGKVDLIYGDPPFFSGKDRHYRQGTEAKYAYGDTWPGGLPEYLEYIRARLELCRDLLADTGSIYIHLDPTVSHYVKVLMDEVFGPERFIREIIWRIGWVSGFKTRAKNWARNHDVILFYSKGPEFRFTKIFIPHEPGYRRRGEPGKAPGKCVDDVWVDMPSIQIMSFAQEKTGYDTQKNENLLERILAASSSAGDLVADVFCGSGTTLVVAERMGRRWVGVDISPAAIEVTQDRLEGIEGCREFEVIRRAEPGP